MTADLTTATDLELDAALMIGYRQHKAASTKAERAEIHEAIMAVIDEQARRQAAWMQARQLMAGAH